MMIESGENSLIFFVTDRIIAAFFCIMSSLEMPRHRGKPAVITKISEALALAAVGWILTGFGYVPNIAQSAYALLGIRLFFGLVPAACIFAALPLLFRYPITRKGHAEIRRRLEDLERVPGDPSTAA